MQDESRLVQSPRTWPHVTDGGGEMEWVELRPGVKVLRRKKAESKMEAPPQNKMRRKSGNK